MDGFTAVGNFHLGLLLHCIVLGSEAILAPLHRLSCMHISSQQVESSSPLTAICRHQLQLYSIRLRD